MGPRRPARPPFDLCGLSTTTPARPLPRPLPPPPLRARPRARLWPGPRPPRRGAGARPCEGKAAGLRGVVQFERRFSCWLRAVVSAGRTEGAGGGSVARPPWARQGPWQRVAATLAGWRISRNEELREYLPNGYPVRVLERSYGRAFSPAAPGPSTARTRGPDVAHELAIQQAEAGEQHLHPPGSHAARDDNRPAPTVPRDNLLVEEAPGALQHLGNSRKGVNLGREDKDKEKDKDKELPPSRLARSQEGGWSGKGARPHMERRPKDPCRHCMCPLNGHPLLPPFNF